jgi:RimJ/RimL family protein N-acetyltransferase
MDATLRMSDEETPYDQHDAWFCHALEDVERTIRIVMRGDLPCGYLRLDRTGRDRARVSICLAPEAQGLGLGRRLLEEADRVAGCLGITRLEAEIHPQNAASQRVFARAGYVQDAVTDGFLTCHRTLEDAT